MNINLSDLPQPTSGIRSPIHERIGLGINTSRSSPCVNPFQPRPGSLGLRAGCDLASAPPLESYHNRCLEHRGTFTKLDIMAISITRTPASVRTRSTLPSRDGDAVANEDSPPANITLETFKDHQSNILPHKKLMIVFPAIALAQMISYMDQTSVSTAVPAIGSGLNLGPSISWVAASFLIASTSIQLVNGRLSDIFGRKPLLLTCLGLLAFGNLVAGFATTPAMLFAFRALSGLGGGAMYGLILSSYTLIRCSG